MKRKWQVPVSIILYILILAAALDFNLLRLIDIRLFLLLMVGTTVLTVPFYERNMNRRELRYVFGKKALEAGFIQSFLILFVGLQNAADGKEILSEVAMSFRPLLYGFCMQVIFSEKLEDPAAVQDKTDAEKAEDGLDYTKRSQPYGLTKRELEIAGLIAEGKTNGDIASVLYISETTVKKHVSNIFEKTGVARREELVRIALGRKEK